MRRSSPERRRLPRRSPSPRARALPVIVFGPSSFETSIADVTAFPPFPSTRDFVKVPLRMPSDLERVPPQNLEAEQSLLGSLLLDKDAVLKIADRLSPNDFYSDHHRVIYEAMQDLYRRHEPIDLLSLSNSLQERGELERIGGGPDPLPLSNPGPTSRPPAPHADIV